MSNEAQSLVWKRAHAKGSNLLVLVKLADCAGDDGRDAWPSPRTLARWCRLTDRGLRYILHRLERDGEIVIDRNEEGRFVMIGRRKFQPDWFIHIRCIYDWEAYQQDDDEAIFSSSHFQTGRRPRQHEPEKIADSSVVATGKVCEQTGSSVPGNRKNHVLHIRKDLLVDPLVEQEQGLTPQAPAMPDDKPEERTPDQNLAVITKLAHEVLELHAQAAGVDVGEIAEAVKRRCALFAIAYRADVVYSAIDAAVYQRRRAGKSPVLPGCAGDAAFRLKELR